MNWRAIYPILLSTTLAFAVVGCSSDSSHGTVSGTVTLDGRPLAKGLIRFVPTDGQSPTADASIANGEFTAKVPVGEKRISVSAPKIVGTRKMYESSDSPTVDIVEELLPERYNVRSALTMTVTAGEQEKEFALVTGK